MSETTQKTLTQLENLLFDCVEEIRKYKLVPQYLPERVEPGIAVNVENETQWSKFLGETLFINQELLRNPNYKQLIFWREAFLFFVPREMRDEWWIHVLANLFPLSVKVSHIVYDEWRILLEEVINFQSQITKKCLTILSSSGPYGLLEVVKQALIQIYTISANIPKIDHKRIETVTKLTPQEFELILDQVYNQSVSLSDSDIDLLKIALLKQTVKAKQISSFTDRHYNTIAKSIKKLHDLNILQNRIELNYPSIGLEQFVAVIDCTKKQSEFYLEPPFHPYIMAQRMNCLNSCVITQFYTGPNRKDFYEQLKAYGEYLIEKNHAFDFNLFKFSNSYRNYNFRYFNPKTKTQQINLYDMAFESGLFETNSEILPPMDHYESENIVIPSRVKSNKVFELEELDINIINLLIQSNYTQRQLQKKLKCDMNQIADRMKFLFDYKILFENIRLNLPDSDGEIAIYIEEDKRLKKAIQNYKSLTERIKTFCSLMPNIYVANVKGSFDGIMFHSYMPHSTSVQLANFFNKFLFDSKNLKIVLGKAAFQKNSIEFDIERWNKGNWVSLYEDFGL
ncbi:MAG: hypothetical protein FK734_17255 [Asgard group archaeon]|nr:hypothetical protein [Asgard group archaeon]